MKVYVKKGCIDSNRDAHEAGTMPDIDKKTDKKLWDLGLVEDYNEKKHGLPKGKDGELQAAKAEIVKLQDEIKSLNESDDATAKTTLETKVGELEGANEVLAGEKTTLETKVVLLEATTEALKGFVEEAIGLPKGQKPNGYVKAE